MANAHLQVSTAEFGIWYWSTRTRFNFPDCRLQDDKIMRWFCSQYIYCWLQGFHDICVTFLLILGNDLSFHVVDALTKNHLRYVIHTRTRYVIDMRQKKLTSSHKKLMQ